MSTRTIGSIILTIMWVLITAFGAALTVTDMTLGTQILRVSLPCLVTAALSFLNPFAPSGFVWRLLSFLGRFATILMVLQALIFAAIWGIAAPNMGVSRIVLALVAICLLIGASFLVLPHLAGRRVAIVMAWATAGLTALFVWQGSSHLNLGWIAWVGLVIRIGAMLLFFRRVRGGSDANSLWAWALWLVGMFELFGLSRLVDYENFGVTGIR